MRVFLVLLSVVIFNTNLFAQKWDGKIKCSTDTMVIEGTLRKEVNNKIIDSTYSYKAITCKTRSRIGVRFDLGVSNYYYGEKTTQWLGQHGGPNFGFYVVAGKLSIGLKFKPWTVEPGSVLIFNGVPLPDYARLNPIKTDYTVGYSFDFKWNISLEPFLGFNRSTFSVINEAELKQKYSLLSTGGLITGLTLNKYFRLKDYEYLALFVSAGYGFVDYSIVHPDLDYGYLEWTAGLSYKGFFNKILERKVH